MSSRTWIKIYCDKWLEGTISEESIMLRGVWVSLLALAGNGKYGDSGEIKAIHGVGFTDQQLTMILKINQKMWGVAKKRLQETGRIEVKTGNIISIINWQKYQSEYDRTSKYRIKDTTSDTTSDTAIEDRGKRIEERVKNKESKEENNILPDFINKDTWNEYLKTRKKPTPNAVNLLIKKLTEFKDSGDDPNEVLERSITNGWTGIFPLGHKKVQRTKSIETDSGMEEIE